MHLLIALATKYFLLLNAIISCLTGFTELAEYLLWIPFRKGVNALPSEFYLILEAALRFVFDSVLVRINI